MCLVLVLTKFQHPKTWAFCLRGFLMYCTKVWISLFEKQKRTSLNIRNASFLRVSAPCGFFCLIVFVSLLLQTKFQCLSSALWFFPFICMCLVKVLTKFQCPKTSTFCLMGFFKYLPHKTAQFLGRYCTYWTMGPLNFFYLTFLRPKKLSPQVGVQYIAMASWDPYWIVPEWYALIHLLRKN
jgi:hypothetical protein